MSTALNPGDLLRVRFWTTAGDQAAVNTIYYLVAGLSGTNNTDQGVANTLDSLFGPHYKGIMSPQCTYNGVTVQLVTTPPRNYVFARAQAGVGTLGTVTCPRQVATLIGFRTPDAGRAFRGRIYLPFPPTVAVELDGGMTAAFAVLVAQFSAALATNTTIDNDPTTPTGFITAVQVIVHSVPKGGVPPPPPPSPIINWVPGDQFATQRRRGSFGRVNVSPI